MVEIPRQVTKYGSSWVILLDKQTKKLLNITEVGDTIILRKGPKQSDEDTDNADTPDEDAGSY